MVAQLVACYFVMWLHVFYAGCWWLVLGVVNSVDIVYLCCVMVILVYVTGCCLYVTVAYCLFLVWVFVIGLFAVWLLFYLYFGLDEFEVGCVLFVSFVIWLGFGVLFGCLLSVVGVVAIVFFCIVGLVWFADGSWCCLFSCLGFVMVRHCGFSCCILIWVLVLTWCFGFGYCVLVCEPWLVVF